MAYWLVKSEPETWSWDQHMKAGADAWTGVRNHQAKIHLKSMKAGDRALYYHSGGEKQVVGITEGVKEAYADPTDASGAFVCVELKAVGPVKRPVTLAEAKADKALAGMVLVNNSRLSVQPVTEAEWKRVLEMAG
jgi:predicted RNA-binding protein with PUA-like domain